MIPAAVEFSVGPYADAIHARLHRFDTERFSERLLARDATLWSPDPVHQAVAANRLGWLAVPAAMAREIGALEAFASEVAAEGFTRAVLLGMGGSSLAPEVLRLTFGVKPGALDLIVLDSTVPATVRAVLESAEAPTTLVVVSSKSGGTIEVSSLEKLFFERARATLAKKAGRGFVAITDPGTALASLARSRGYRRVFSNPPDIGGRYSALSFFGLVPAALIGADLSSVLERARAEIGTLAPGRPAAEIHGLELGAALGELALAGRNKVTLLAGPRFESFGAWVEQLLAESTGKDGRGLVPIAGEPPREPGAYGEDRVFVALGPTPADRERLALLARSGHPVLSWEIASPVDLGAEFVRWEIATAAAAAVLGVDPFDEPNVAEAKQTTQMVLDKLVEHGRLSDPRPVVVQGDRRAFAPLAVESAAGAVGASRPASPAAWVPALLALAKPGDYFTALAYLPRTAGVDSRLRQICGVAGNRMRIATARGYGPRYLHSTGQLHKGGPNRGIFLLLTADSGEELAIPGERYGFGALCSAQAAGDFQVLARRGRRVLRIHLGSGIEPGLDSILEALATA